MKKQLPVFIPVLFIFFLFFVCETFSQEAALTAENPLNIDTKEHSVSILAFYNGSHPEPTHHGIVSKTGKLYRKAFFVALVDPKIFHDALARAGFKPGNNMTMDNMDKTFVKGDLLDVSVSWQGGKRVYKLDELIRDSNSKPLAVRFGGNLPLAVKKNTGCLLCLDSCSVGITSNSNYTYGAIDNRKEVKFTGNGEALPANGTLVIIRFKPKK